AAPLVAALGASMDRAYRTRVGPSIARWLAVAESPVHSDVMLGAAGALLAASEIEGLRPGVIPRRFVRRLHRLCSFSLASLLNDALRRPVYLGFAHGIAGFLAALESTRRGFGLGVEADLRERSLEILEGRSVKAWKGTIVWPVHSDGRQPTISGWCHGGPGIALGLLVAGHSSGWKPYL